jgi:hypothetical protein
MNRCGTDHPSFKAKDPSVMKYLQSTHFFISDLLFATHGSIFLKFNLALRLRARDADAFDAPLKTESVFAFDVAA